MILGENSSRAIIIKGGDNTVKEKTGRQQTTNRVAKKTKIVRKVRKKRERLLGKRLSRSAPLQNNNVI